MLRFNVSFTFFKIFPALVRLHKKRRLRTQILIEMKILVFATTIKKEKDALNISNMLKNYFGLKSASFDLTDRDNILRVEGKNLIPKKIEQTLDFLGFQCRLLT